MVSSNINGSLSFSLNAGTTTDKSVVAGSNTEGKGRGFEDDLCERYFFSESYVIIGGGDQYMRARYS